MSLEAPCFSSRYPRRSLTHEFSTDLRLEGRSKASLEMVVVNRLAEVTNDPVF